MKKNMLEVSRKKILSQITKLKKTDFNYKYVIQEIVYLILKVEIILYNNKLKKNPKTIIKIFLEDFSDRLSILAKISKFSNNKKVDKQIFILEKTQKGLFQKLWVYYNFAEFKKERIGRYMRRIKINKLEKIIKNKNCVDFGCGHGNFLTALIKSGSKSGVGIDYGIDSIKYAKKISSILKLDKKLKFYQRSVYKSGLKSKNFDFAINNGVFHHLKNEELAYKEVHRVLKKDGYFWIYTDGGGGLRDFINDMCRGILEKINYDYVVDVIRSMALSKNKVYHLCDHVNAKYRHTTKEELIKKLSKIGFKNFTQLKGGELTDSDKPFVKDKFFKEKFGSGDLRILCQKI